MSLTPNEERIMDLRERGAMPRQIARESGLSHAYVRRVVTMYSDDGSQIRRHRDAMRLGSCQLLARLQSLKENAHG